MDEEGYSLALGSPRAGFLASAQPGLGVPYCRSGGVCGQPGGSLGPLAWRTISVGHGFIWEGHRNILHCDAVHDGGEGVQVVSICSISCEQMICKEKVEVCHLGEEGVPWSRTGG